MFLDISQVLRDDSFLFEILIHFDEPKLFVSLFRETGVKSRV
jgi:hypothetical protein